MMASRGTNPSLSGSMFRSMLAFSLVGILLFALIAASIVYVTLDRDASSRLLAQAHEAASYLDAIPSEQAPATLAEQFGSDVRYTLISPDGTVLFDSATPVSELPSLEDHASRPEVQAALAGSDGTVARYSTTLGTDTIYAAVPLAGGGALRLSETRESLAAFFSGSLAIPLAITTAIILVLALLFSRIVTRRLMRPLDRIDVSAPLESDTYAEMEPLLERINSQQMRLVTQNRELARAETMRRDFSANVSHEMKTPLQVISGYAELMANGIVQPEDVRQFGAVIYQESQSMRALIDDILMLSRLEEGAFDERARTPVELEVVAEQAISRLRKLASDASVRVSLEASSACVIGSEPLLEQMIHNLVENAIRYNHEGGTVDVRIGVEQTGAPDGEPDDTPAPMAVIRVSDTGSGIPAKDIEKVFERFYRLEKSRSKETGGTGLGLAIVKHAVQYHDGTIEVQSAEGVGTTFVVRIPAIA